MGISNSTRAFQQEKWASVLMSLEDDQFVGRQKELEFFRDFLYGNKKILHFYGTGGIGKTYLLHAFQRVTEDMNGFVYLMVDSEDFAGSPAHFVEQILYVLHSKLDIDLIGDASNTSLNQCIHALGKASQQYHLVLAIDTFEKMGPLERWFREFFLRNLPHSTSVLLAGRYPLTSGWMDSPAWRSLLTQKLLKGFNYEQTRSYLYKSGIRNESALQEYWQFTMGHPLTVYLSTMTGNQDGEEDLPEDKHQILSYLTTKWLKEVTDPQLQELVEAAAIQRHFNQGTLAYVLNRDISTTLFTQLTSLSFVNQSTNGWGMHDLIRSAILVNLQQRTPDHYQSLKQRCASYYLHKINTNQTTAKDIAEYFYHIGEDVIQSSFFQGHLDTKKYIEHVGPHNFHEVEAYFEKRRKQTEESIAHYYHRQSDQTYKYFVSAEHNQRENELIDAGYVEKLGYNVCKLVKNHDGDTIGISIIVPIHSFTLEHLKKEPVSRAYFSQLTEKEEKTYRAPRDTCSGFFIRMLDCLDAEDSHTRSFLLYNLFPLLLSGGRIITSTPIPFFRKLILAFGFEEVPEATHYDFGANRPSPTYLLDVRGSRLTEYLKQFSPQDGYIRRVAARHGLTKREQEILQYIHDEYSNKAISKELYITEVTVKKHVSKILKKFDVRNRTQLMKRISGISS
ncbi:LuxR C-terminal-related transcriptional regulator [Halobacillus litoralis]|uniref:LuxR C-terminal-related transcriptional regulator n=1 Tax=Halobacillus litoralis TaxID=45668 RepID=UPI00299EAC35|nr:LuxR C-terminal-related transcriptional regulator [Halobacillus litoralis]